MELTGRLNGGGSKLVYPPQNLVDIVWKDRPVREGRPIGVHMIRLVVISTILFDRERRKGTGS